MSYTDILNFLREDILSNKSVQNYHIRSKIELYKLTKRLDFDDIDLIEAVAKQMLIDRLLLLSKVIEARKILEPSFTRSIDDYGFYDEYKTINDRWDEITKHRTGRFESVRTQVTDDSVIVHCRYIKSTKPEPPAITLKELRQK